MINPGVPTLILNYYVIPIYVHENVSELSLDPPGQSFRHIPSIIVNSDGISMMMTAPDGTVCRTVASIFQSALLLMTSSDGVRTIGVMSF